MSEPTIFGQLARDFEHRLHHAGHSITSHLQHHPHNESSTPDTKGSTRMSITDTVKADLKEVFANVHGWIDDAEQKVPALLSDFAKVEQSPVVQEIVKLGGLVLPPEVEASIVGLIQMGGKMAASAAGSITAPAAAAPAGTDTATATATASAPAAG